MTCMKSAKVGDVIRLTQLREAYFSTGAASEDRPAYFVVATVQPSFLKCKPLFVQVHYDSTSWMIANDAEHRLSWGDGPYEIIAEEDVPDEVWAAIAKRVLLKGETV